MKLKNLYKMNIYFFKRFKKIQKKTIKISFFKNRKYLISNERGPNIGLVEGPEPQGERGRKTKRPIRGHIWHLD